MVSTPLKTRDPAPVDVFDIFPDICDDYSFYPSLPDEHFHGQPNHSDGLFLNCLHEMVISFRLQCNGLIGMYWSIPAGMEW